MLLTPKTRHECISVDLQCPPTPPRRETSIVRLPRHLPSPPPPLSSFGVKRIPPRSLNSFFNRSQSSLSSTSTAAAAAAEPELEGFFLARPVTPTFQTSSASAASEPELEGFFLAPPEALTLSSRETSAAHQTPPILLRPRPVGYARLHARTIARF